MKRNAERASRFPIPNSRLNLDPVKIIWDDVAENKSLEIAANYYEKVCGDIDQEIFRLEIGKNELKKCRVSPDAFIQMCLQLAHFRHKGKFALTYEAAVTLLFKDGRTETIRPCSESVVEFVELFEQKGDKKETVAALKRAMENHSRMSKEAMIGQGFDRHLFALANCAQKRNTECDFLANYSRDKYELSTSMTPVGLGGSWREKIFIGGGFFYPDGYGICYCPTEKITYFQVTGSLSDTSRCAKTFAIAIQDAISDVLTLLKETT